MTTNLDPAVRRVVQHINRSAGQHKRALAAPSVSEGTRSAREILRSVPMTSDPLALHRIDTSLMPRDSGCAVGHMAIKPAPRPLVSMDCCGDASCNDAHCEGRGAALLRAEDDEDHKDIDPVMRRRVWIGIVAWCAVIGAGVVVLGVRMVFGA